MHQELTSQVEGIVRLYLIPMAWKVSGGIAVWLIGNYAIKFLRGGLRRTMRLRHIDVTLARYLDTSTTVVLQLLVLIAVLGVLGVETTSFAALLAAAGIAIGAAWSGLLSNFAAGLFLILTITPAGCTLAVRPCCHNDHYWQVYFDTNRVIGQMLAVR